MSPTLVDFEIRVSLSRRISAAIAWTVINAPKKEERAAVASGPPSYRPEISQTAECAR
jgi:hypothetical protein